MESNFAGMHYCINTRDFGHANLAMSPIATVVYISALLFGSTLWGNVLKIADGTIFGKSERVVAA